MVYTTLATSLHSGQDLPIPGQCHLILDTLETDGNFLLHHYISAFLRYGTASSVPRVVLVGCQHIFSHYAAIGRKLGVNLMTAKAKGDLVFIDAQSRWSSNITARPDPSKSGLPTAPTVSLSAGDSLHTLYNVIQQACRFETDRQQRTVLIIDDFTALLFAGHDVSSCLSFVRSLKLLCLKYHMNLVLLAHDDTAFELDPEHDLLIRSMGRLANVILAVRGLDSGASRDVHGQLTLSYGPAGMKSTADIMAGFHPRVLQYRLSDNTVQFFAPGYSAAVL